MHRSRRRSLWTFMFAPLCAATLLLALAGGLCAPGASAEEAPTVTVRVEGLDATLIPPTQVTLSGSPVVKDGHPEDSCAITSALGALQLASDGNWAGPWELGQYAIFTIDGETHEFEKESKANYYWSFWLNDKESEEGACAVQLHQGDRVLFFPSCYGEQCPSPAPLPLEAEAPASADVGEPIQVTVRQYTSAGVGSEVAGASVVGGGAGALTEAHGRATLTFAHAGETTVYVNAPDSIRTEAAVCVHNGDDGTCGTTAPAPCPLVSSGASSCGPPVVCPAAASTQASAVSCPPLPTPAPEVARAAGVVNGHAYARRRGPRVLAGSVEVPLGDTLHAVRIALSRRAHGRCDAFSGPRAAFVRVSCRAAPRFFAVASTSSFTYLLPARLRAGRYVYDVEAVNDAGQVTPLTNGVSHVAFSVR